LTFQLLDGFPWALALACVPLHDNGWEWKLSATSFCFRCAKAPAIALSSTRNVPAARLTLPHRRYRSLADAHSRHCRGHDDCAHRLP